MLIPQPNARYVGRNLLMSHYCGAELHLCGAEMESVRNMPLAYAAAAYQLLRHRLREGRFPYFIPPGGSSLLGVVGFVNAALELRKQITDGEMPEPECVHVASGTMGTAVGLALGLRAANVSGRVVSVAVCSGKFVNAKAMIRLISRTNSLLHSLDTSCDHALIFCQSNGTRACPCTIAAYPIMVRVIMKADVDKARMLAESKNRLTNIHIIPLTTSMRLGRDSI